MVTVSACTGEAVLTATLPKVIWDGLGAIPPTARPVPFKGTTIGSTPRLLTVAVNDPGWLPLAVGVKLTPTVQEEVAGSLAAQVVKAETRLYGPVRARARLFPAWPLRLLTASVRGEAVVPTGVDGKFNDVTLDCKKMGDVPVPVRLTVAVDGVALLAVTVSVAPSTPAAEGEKVI